MIWLTWRQHRIEALVTFVVLAAIAVFLLITGLAMSHDVQRSGLGACLARAGSDSSTDICGSLGELFVKQYGSLIVFVGATLLLPGLLGAMAGAPLMAREYEQRTNLLIWMQSITRTRWLTTQVALVLGAGALAAGALLALLIWWYRPFAQLIGSFNQVAYDFSGPVFVAGTVMALAVGIAAGTATRRTVLAIFLTLALLLAIHIVVEFNLRPNFQPPIVVTWPLSQGNNAPVTLGQQDWQVASGFLDAQGNRADGVRCYGDNQTPAQCMQADGYRGYYLVYQPASRFWPFQWIESGIYLGLAALALGLTERARRTRRGLSPSRQAGVPGFSPCLSVARMVHAF